MDKQLLCPVCGASNNELNKFCTDCGCNLEKVDAIKITHSPQSNLVDNIKSQVKEFGNIAQQSLSGASNTILDKASAVTLGTENDFVQQKVAEAMANLVNMMINVSNDVKNSVTSDMVNAIDLNARVNFVAFSIGVTVDLASLQKGKTNEVHNADKPEDNTHDYGLAHE